MAEKPTYNELKQRIKALEQEVMHCRRMENAHKLDKDQFESILLNIQCITYRCALDKAWTMMYMSPHVDQLTGYPSSDFINNAVRTYESIIHRDDSEYVAQSVNEAIKSGKPWEIEYRIIHKDKDLRWVYEKGRGVINRTGRMEYLDGFIIDITDRKQAEEALKLSEEKYRILVENASDAIFVAQDEVIKFSNPRTEELTGYSSKELMKMPFAVFIHSDDRAKVIDRHRKRLKGEKAVSTYAFKLMNKSGLEKTVQVNTVLIQWEGRPATLNFLRDITQIRKIEFQLRQSQKMETIGTLAGGIAHDFNNILFPIVGYTEMLLEDISEDSPLRHNLNEIYISALRAKDLVKQILTFSRRENTELKPMKLQPIVKEVLKLLRSSIPTTIDIKQDISTDCCVVKADPTQIHQIIMNLATNAYHAMEETGGELRVGLTEVELGEYDLISPDMKPGVYACLSVADTGMGMEKKVMEKIFEPFFTTKEKGRGTGMGLSMVHGFVNSMGGAIHVYSEPGKGTEFYVYLPIVEMSPKVPTTRIKELLQGGNERVLLVDDEIVILEMAKQMLERLGYQVVAHTSSIKALETFRSAPGKFDLVITDRAMPNMAGDQLAAELVKIRPDIPILLCTGFSETMSESKATSVGIKGFLQKPIVMKDFFEKIREVLDNQNDIPA